MRYECDEPGYEANFVEFSRAWTRKERADYIALQGDDWLALVGRKITACHLDCVSGPPITHGHKLTQNAVDDAIDAIVWDWFSAVLLRFRVEMGQLGEALRRRSLPTFATKAAEMIVEVTPTVAANSPTN
jgi:hypothetical protein